MTVYNVGALKGVYNQTGRHFLSLLPLIAVTLDLGLFAERSHCSQRCQAGSSASSLEQN